MRTAYEVKYSRATDGTELLFTKTGVLQLLYNSRGFLHHYCVDSTMYKR